MKKHLLFLFSIIICNTSFSQDWLRMMQEPNGNLYNIQKVFHNYWLDKDSTQKGNGYKVFRRWEHFAEPRVYPSGNISQLSLTSKNYSDFLKNNSNSNSKIASTTWTARGCFGALSYPAYPQYVAAGRIDFVRIDPINSAIMYCGSPTGGLWKTTNSGATWTALSDNLPITGFSDIAIDPTNNNILYLATGDGNSGYVHSIGILKSIDGGVTWNTTGLTFTLLQYRSILRLIIDPSNPQVLIATTSVGIWRTFNGGVTWSQSATVSQLDLEFKPTDPNTVYAAGYYGFYISTDNGITFTQVSAGIPTTNIGGMKVSVTPADPNYVYALCTSTNGGFGGFYRSTNSGVSFTAMNTSTYNILGYTPTTAGGQGSYNLCMDVHQTQKNLITVAGIYPWYSADGGVTWTQLTTSSNPNYIHADHHDIVYSAANEIFLCNDGGLHKYAAPATIYNMTGSMNIAEIYKIGLSSLSPDKWITGLQDNGTSIHTPTTYSFTMGADGEDCFIDRTNDMNVFASSQYGGFNRSTDGGLTYLGIPFFAGTAAWTAPWHQDPAVANTIYAAKTDLWRSTNLAASFSSLTPIPTTGNVTEFQIAPSNNQVIYVIKNGNVFKTTDAGVSWTDITAGLPIAFAYPVYITIDPTDPNNVWITFSSFSPGNKIYVTTDGGSTWTNVSYNLPNIPATCAVYLPGSGDGIYIGMDVGVYYMDNTMSSWMLYNTGLPNVQISQLAISPAAPTKLRAATYGRGVYEVDVLAAPVSNFSIASGPYCTGQNIQFNDMSSFTPISWTWSVNPTTAVVTSSNSQNPNINFTNPGTYTVSLTSSNIIGPGNVVTQTITVNAPPTVSVAVATQTICTGEYVVFSVSGASTYTWSDGAGNNPLAIYSPTANSTYTVWGSNSFGCVSAVPLSVIVSSCIGINELNANGQNILVYPNPNQGTFTVELKKDADIALINALGELLFEKKLKQGKNEININNYSSGIYYFKATSNNKSSVIKILKEK